MKQRFLSGQSVRKPGSWHQPGHKRKLCGSLGLGFPICPTRELDHLITMSFSALTCHQFNRVLYFSPLSRRMNPEAHFENWKCWLIFLVLSPGFSWVTYGFISCFHFCTSDSFVICRCFIFVVVHNVRFCKRQVHTQNLEVYLIMSYMFPSKSNKQIKNCKLSPFFKVAELLALF